MELIERGVRAADSRHRFSHLGLYQEAVVRHCDTAYMSIWRADRVGRGDWMTGQIKSIGFIGLGEIGSKRVLVGTEQRTA